MRPRRKCELCGNPVEPDLVKTRKNAGKSILCKACVLKERETSKAARIKAKQELFSTRRCIVCGQPLQWKDTYDLKSPQYWPTTCSTRCHGIAAKMDSKLTKEEAEKRIEAFLIGVGHPCTYAETVHGCHIASKVVTRLGISILDMQKRIFGLDVERIHAKDTEPVIAPVTLEDVKLKHGLACTAFSDIIDALDALRRDKREIDKALIEDIMKAYICSCKHYVNKTAMYHEVFRSRDVYWPIIKRIDTARLNSLFGYRDPKRSWFELQASKMLRELFGSGAVSIEHTFPDCRSEKNFPLRFDFYVPVVNLLVEIDGSQHTNQASGFYKNETVINDAIKTAYAKDRGYELIRIETTPRFTFTERLHKALLDVIKPVELLEPPPGNAEGDQQPSSDNETWDLQPDLGF